MDHRLQAVHDDAMYDTATDDIRSAVPQPGGSCDRIEKSGLPDTIQDIGDKRLQGGL